jgi:hypothetical protein
MIEVSAEYQREAWRRAKERFAWLSPCDEAAPRAPEGFPRTQGYRYGTQC